MKILFSFSAVVLLFGLYMLFRNSCVYRFRMKIIDTDVYLYRRLPSYTEMLSRFWVWPLRKFLPK